MTERLTYHIASSAKEAQEKELSEIRFKKLEEIYAYWGNYERLAKRIGLNNNSKENCIKAEGGKKRKGVTLKDIETVLEMANLAADMNLEDRFSYQVRGLQEVVCFPKPSIP